MEELFIQQPNIKTSVWDDYVPIIQDGRHTDVYLTSQIEEPSVYNKLCHILNKAYAGDTVTLHINNAGGYVDSGFMIIDAIKNSKAKVKAKLSGTVASIATIVSLACEIVSIADYIQFMIHNYSSSSGSGAKGHELRARVEFTDTELNAAFSEIYKGFLTDHEMELVIAGKDIWMGKEELLARLQARAKKDNEALENIEKSREYK